MALIVITIQDTATGAVVSLAAEPPMNMSVPAEGEAQMLAHLMLGALPANQPGEAEPVAPLCPECGGEGITHIGINESPTAACRKCEGTGSPRPTPRLGAQGTLEQPVKLDGAPIAAAVTL